MNFSISKIQEEDQMHLSSLIISMMLMEVVQNQIQSFVGGHMEFGPIIVMLKVQNNVLFGVILEQ